MTKCHDCPAPAQPNRVRCRACALKHGARSTRRQLARMAAGQCVRCPNPAMPNRARCRSCALKATACSSRHYHAAKARKVAA